MAAKGIKGNLEALLEWWVIGKGANILKLFDTKEEYGAHLNWVPDSSSVLLWLEISSPGYT